MMTNRSPRQSEKAKYAIPFRTNVSAGVSAACATKLDDCANSNSNNSSECRDFARSCCKP